MNARLLKKITRKSLLAVALSMTMFLAACGGGGGGGGSDPTPPPPPTPGVTANPASITLTEDGTATFDVVLNVEPTDDVTVTVTSLDTSEATVTAGGSLTFTATGGTTPWDTPQTVTVTGATDDTADGNQNISIEMDTSTSTDAVYAALAATTVAAQVSDIDTAGITLTTNTLGTSEPNTSSTFDVVLNTMPDADVVITVTSTDLSEGTVAPGTLTFTSGDWFTAQTVTVTGEDDALVDGPVTYDVTLTVATTDTTGYNGLTITPVSVTNADDDSAGATISTGTLTTAEGGSSVTYTVVLNTSPDGDVVIDVASLDSSEGTVLPATLTFNMTGGGAPWDTPQTMTVTPADDAMEDGPVTYDVTHTIDTVNTTDTTGYDGATIAAVAVTNTDNDTAGVTVTPVTTTFSENGGSGSYTVALTTEPTGADVVIDVTAYDASEVALSTTSLTFTPTGGGSPWNTVQTVNLTGVDDAMADTNQTFNITMAVAAGGSTEYTGATVAPVSVTVTDDDAAGVTVTPVTTTFSENGGAGSYTVVLATEPVAGDVVIDVTAYDASEVALSTTSLTFTITGGGSPWSTAQTVTLAGVDDAMADTNQTFNITMAVAAGSSAEYIGKTVSPVSVTVTDDDAAGVTVTPVTTTFSENGGTGSFTIQLNTEPVTGTVTIQISSIDISEFDVNGGAYTFTFTQSGGGSPWNIAQTGVLTGNDDDMADGNQTHTMGFAPTLSSSAEYPVGLAITPIDITVTDDDTAGVTVTPVSTTFGENAGSGSYTVALNTEPTGADVVINITNPFASRMGIAPASLTFTPTGGGSPWNTAQTVVLSGVDNSFDDGNAVGNVTMAVAAGGSTEYPTSTAVSSVPVTVTDDDAAGATVTAVTTTFSENGGVGSYTVALNTEPTGADVVINITNPFASRMGIAPTSLTFTPTGGGSPWNTAQTVVLSGIDNMNADGNATGDITMAVAAGGSAEYIGTTISPVAVVVMDDDVAGITATPTSMVVTEFGQTVDFTVQLNTEPLGNVVIDVPNPAGGFPAKLTGATQTLTFTITGGASPWNTPQTVSFFTVDNTNLNDSTTVTATMTVVAGSSAEYLSVTPPSVAIIIMDNDAAPAADYMNVSIDGGASTNYSEAGLISVSGYLDITDPDGLTTNVSLLDMGVGVIAQLSFLGTTKGVKTFNAGDTSGMYLDPTYVFYVEDGTAVTSGSINVVNYSVTNGVINGGFDMTLCGIADIMSIPSTCDATTAVNFAGYFDTALDPDQGSTANPQWVTLDDANGASTHAVDSTYSVGTNYYTVNGLSPGLEYSIDMGISAGGDLDLYLADNTFTPITCDVLDDTYNGTGTPEQCVFTADGSGSAYFYVDYFGGTAQEVYTIGVTTYVVAGSPDLSVVITGATYDGGTDQLTVNYTITNNGAADHDASVTPVDIDGFFNPAVAPALGATSASFMSINTGVITAGGGTISNTLVIFGNATDSTGTAYLIVDTFDYVAESNETNNVSAGFGW